MLSAWYSTTWWSWCVPEDEKKKKCIIKLQPKSKVV